MRFLSLELLDVLIQNIYSTCAQNTVGRKQVTETPKLSNGRKNLLSVLSVHHLI